MKIRTNLKEELKVRVNVCELLLNLFEWLLCVRETGPLRNWNQSVQVRGRVAIEYCQNRWAAKIIRCLRIFRLISWRCAKRLSTFTVDRFQHLAKKHTLWIWCIKMLSCAYRQKKYFEMFFSSPARQSITGTCKICRSSRVQLRFPIFGSFRFYPSRRQLQSENKRSLVVSR